jgi:two-component system phosphate regulon sensor histidine kinase PhoR
VIRIPNFERYVERGMNSSEGFYEEIEKNGVFLLVGFNGIKEGEKLLITFRDITEFKQLEKIKKDFIVNLTHELKTPLTAIKGFIETLEIEEKNITNKNYIEIIKRHANRMNQIILDLMTLSELEEKKTVLDLSPIHLGDLLDNLMNIFKDQIRKKKLKIAINIDSKLESFQGERFKIEQLLINLIDNAIKYTEKGTISISAESDARHIIIKIEDTGIGIPEDNIPRIFERFYVVDKSRSRKLGGTGLGLSIVKHIVYLHQGDIEVRSEPNKGTVFIVRLPLNLEN